MKLPDIKTEREAHGKGDIIIGVDEAGRGPLAGPVVAAAVWINPDFFGCNFGEKKLIRDSKSLSEKQRGDILRYMVKSNDFVIGIGEVSHKMIDRMNILNATFLAMRLAVDNLKEKSKATAKLRFINSKQKNICLFVDGNRKIPGIKHRQRIFPRGDQIIFSIAAASICAKVHRDGIMKKYHKKYSLYGFDRHKGYGTKFHRQALQKHGPCDIHRRSFGPVSGLTPNI